MANITLPATGTGSPTPIVETIDGPASASRQVVSIGDRAGGAVDSIGGLTESAPGTDTASSGLNGRLQRIAQRLSSLIALLPTALTLSGNLKVAILEQTVAGLAVTPAAGTVSVVTTGGTSVVAVSGPCNGGYIANPANAARQGIGTAEAIYIDMVTAPSSTEASANGTTSAIDPGGTFDIPPLATGVNVRVNAATSSHKFTVVKF